MPPAAFRPPNRILMGPGPSDVPRRVRDALSRRTIGHLDPEFVSFMDAIKFLLQRAFVCEHAMTMPVSGPGTAGMEACVVNLLEPGDTIIVCRNGVFGGRIAQMAARCGARVVTVDDAWGRAVTPEKVEAALKAAPEAKVLAFVQAETSTGALSCAQTLGRLARQYECLSLVDAVTSLGGSELRVGAWELDAVYGGTQKCLSAPPGLAPVTFSERAVEAVRARSAPVQSWFMDVGLVMGYWGSASKRSYHHTAPINALYGLHEALLMLEEEGLESTWDRHRRNHKALRAGLEVLGLRMIVPRSERLPQLNAVRVPKGVDEARVRRRVLAEHNLEIGAGLGDLAGKIWRIGLMGYSSRRENILTCLSALASALVAENMRVSSKEAVMAAMRILEE